MGQDQVATATKSGFIDRLKFWKSNDAEDGGKKKDKAKKGGKQPDETHDAYQAGPQQPALPWDPARAPAATFPLLPQQPAPQPY